jgi:hypothetical protein
MHEFRVALIAEHLLFTLPTRLEIPRDSQYKVFETLPTILHIFIPTGALVHVKFSPTSTGVVPLLLEPL